ncbi:hypothetical protein PF004_g32654 [Phytophthora fragariae]|uniref:Uncharacterized protein n=1 Tax=Phytophthora fragariae TaxID=53985 RepID=A0A6G0M6I2_9STRA|nr:hypothetical protein PF004_g32654 [Phytophthora fragariae]
MNAPPPLVAAARACHLALTTPSAETAHIPPSDCRRQAHFAILRRWISRQSWARRCGNGHCAFGWGDAHAPGGVDGKRLLRVEDN